MSRFIEVSWTGVDGSVWDLTDYLSPVQLVSAEFPTMPQFTQQFAASPARDGRRYEGTTWQEANCILTVVVGDVVAPEGFKHRRKGTEWRLLDRSFRRSVSPDATGELTITDRNSGTLRRLRLRLDKPLTLPSAEDPAILGVVTYSLPVNTSTSTPTTRRSPTRTASPCGIRWGSPTRCSPPSSPVRQCRCTPR
jgi:hypothetical protein